MPISGQGVESNYNSPPLDRFWLTPDGQYTITLALSSNGAWSGQTSGRWTGSLTPVPNFAELLAQDQAVEDKRLEAAQSPVRSGTEYMSASIDFGGYPRTQGVIGLRILSLDSSVMAFTAELFDPQEPPITWPLNGAISFKSGRAFYTLTYTGIDHEDFKFKGHSNNYLKQYFRSNNAEVELSPAPTGEGLYGRYNNRRNYSGFDLTFSKSKDPAPETPAPKAAPATAPALPAYPPLAVDGKPRAAAHFVRLENDTVQLALQVLAPGKALEAIRIDNVGGVSSLWRSDGKDKGAPLAVSRGATRLTSGAEAMSTCTLSPSRITGPLPARPRSFA